MGVKIRNAKKCSRCSNILKDGELYTCEKCLERVRTYSNRHRQMARENNLCLRCGKPHDRGKAFCQSCADIRNAKTREIRAELRQMRICPACAKNKLYGDEKYCIDCRGNFAKLSYQRYLDDPEKKNRQNRESAKRVRAERVEQGLCSQCGGKREDTRYKMCGKCRAKLRETHRKFNPAPKSEEKFINGICRFCDNPVEPGLKVCPEHRKQLSRASQSRTKVQIYNAKMLSRY